MQNDGAIPTSNTRDVNVVLSLPKERLNGGNSNFKTENCLNLGFALIWAQFRNTEIRNNPQPHSVYLFQLVQLG